MLVHPLSEGQGGEAHGENTGLGKDARVHDALGEREVLELQLLAENVGGKWGASTEDEGKSVIVQAVEDGVVYRHRALRHSAARNHIIRQAPLFWAAIHTADAKFVAQWVQE